MRGRDSKWVTHSGLSSNTALNSITVCQLHAMAYVLRQQPLTKDQSSTGRAVACLHFPLHSAALCEVCSAACSWFCFLRCGVTSSNFKLLRHMTSGCDCYCKCTLVCLLCNSCFKHSFWYTVPCALHLSMYIYSCQQCSFSPSSKKKNRATCKFMWHLVCIQIWVFLNSKLTLLCIKPFITFYIFYFCNPTPSLSSCVPPLF